MNSVNVVALKPIFAANSANFRGAEKKSAPIREICGRGFDAVFQKECER